MSYQMIHACIAYDLLKSLPDIKYQADFILASVSPDSVHMNDDFDISMKIRSHCFEGCGEWTDTKEPDRWREQILALWDKYKDSPAEIRDFALGYIVHCLTDRCNDMDIWVPLRDKYAGTAGYPAFRERFQYEARHIDLWLYQNSKNSDAIFQMLKTGRAFDMDGLIRVDSLEKQRWHLLHEQYKCDIINADAYKYVTKEKITIFLETSVQKILKDIRSLG